MAKYDWEFIKPLDQSSAIANMALGNKQITDGLQGMVDSVTGLSDAYKQRNTDEILNALYTAQASSDLPTAMNAVQALQAQYGKGYDQAKVREAIDTRGSTLGQRDLQAINLQQAQAAQAALPQIKQMQLERLKAIGAPQAQIDALNAIDGIDVSNFTTGLISDAVDKRNHTDSRSDRAEDVKWRKDQAKQAQENWNAEFDLRKDKDTWERAGDISKENPASVGYGVDENGNPVVVGSSGISRMDAYGALSGVRGIRNNNPGNLNYAGQRGATRENGKGRFAAFNTPEEGLHAMSRQLDLHFNGTSAASKKVGRPLQSIADIVSAWAPPGENDTKLYIAQVAKDLGVSPTAKLNLKDPTTKMALMQSIVKKENGGNPYSIEQYQAGISGKIGTSGQALANIGGGGLVPQKAMSEVSSGYQNAIAKLTADFNAESLKSQQKGSLAATGKSLSTWAAGKKDNGIIFSGNNSWFTSASDLVNLAKKDPTFSKLPETAQMNILEGAYAKMNDVNKLQYVPDGDLQKFISNESKNYHTSRKDAFNQAKEAAFEQSYQAMVQAYQAVGARPPSREGARKLLEPQSTTSKASTAVQVSNESNSAPSTKPNTKADTSKTTSAGKASGYLLSGAKVVARENAVKQGKERASNVANMPTQQELQAMRAKALSKAKTKKEKEEADRAFKKLQEEKAKNHKLSPKTKALLNEFGGGILK